MFQTAKQPFIFHYQRLNHHLVTIQPPFFITMFHHHQINGSTFSQQQPPALLDVAPTGPCLYRAPFLPPDLSSHSRWSGYAGPGVGGHADSQHLKREKSRQKTVGSY